jgi:hypothetical protein
LNVLKAILFFQFKIFVAHQVLGQSSKRHPFINVPVITNGSSDTMEYLMHIHAHLDVFKNGQTNPIPPNTGTIPNQCIYWLHTHDDTGVIHVESHK